MSEARQTEILESFIEPLGISVTEDIEAENSFSDDIAIRKGFFNLSIWGTFSASVVVQRSFDGTTWLDVATFTSPTEEAGFEPTGADYRAGVKTGAYSSGTVNVRISQ